MDSLDDAKQLLEDARGRAALWELLWKAAHKHEEGRPVPTLPSDDVIKNDLQRILLLKRKKFLGLF